MLNLIESIKAVNAAAFEKRAAFNKEIAMYDNAVKILKQLNEACIACDGKGKILIKRVCIEDDVERSSNWRECPACGGTGYERKD